MAASFNKVILMGNLTRDPETRQFSNGGYVCKFGLAVNRVYYTKQGEKREEVTFVDIEAFDKSAETISKYMSKGSSILIEGRLKLDQWQDQQGNNQSRLRVVCESFQFTGGRGDSDGGGNASRGGGSTSQYDQAAPSPRQTRGNSNRAPEPEPDFDGGDDVPF